MTVTISQFTHADMPLGTPLASVDKDGVTLWPSGIGQGTSISMSIADWHQLKYSADMTIEIAKHRALREYAAQEGVGT